MLKSLPELRNLSLGNNPDFDFCSRNLGQADGDPKPPPLLERISLRNTQLTELCFEEWDTLLYIDLSSSNVTRLQFDKLPSPQRGPLEVDLRGNYITILPLSREDYTMMINKYNEQAESLTIFVDLTLDCDCHHGWFARALRSLPRLHLKGAHCSNGQQLQDQPPEKLECDKFPCSECFCRHAWQDNVTEADCHGTGLRFMPNLTRLPNLRTLLVSNNHIDTLQEEDIGETLLVMNLRDNLISRINPEVLARIFAVPERNVWLSHNPLVCDCENVILIIMLQEHKAQVPDFDQITCISDGEKIFAVSEVNADTLCSAAHERFLLIISASGGSLIALIALATVLLYRYWSELKIFLYSRGWCLFCVTENEVDADRQYDAFISFAHEDEQFVVEELLPWLEDYPDLKVCMHTRDWMPGEPILTQIISSVEQSRRTIVLLSRNFVRSVWGMLEFRTAHVSALREGRVRVIVIVLDDVIDDQSLDAELSRYLLTNTYLRWGSPRFWERLRFALPRRGLSHILEEIEDTRRDNSQQNITEPSQDTLRDLNSQPDTEQSEESRSSAPCIRQPRDQRETSSSEQITLRTFSEWNADG